MQHKETWYCLTLIAIPPLHKQTTVPVVRIIQVFYFIPFDSFNKHAVRLIVRVALHDLFAIYSFNAAYLSHGLPNILLVRQSAYEIQTVPRSSVLVPHPAGRSIHALSPKNVCKDRCFWVHEVVSADPSRVQLLFVRLSCHVFLRWWRC